LNNVKTYEQLLQRSSMNGYKIDSILYNGYVATSTLQSIQDKAIHSRTQLRLNNEIDEQNEKLTNLKLKRLDSRFLLESQLNQLKCEFEQKMTDVRAEFDSKMSQLKHESDILIKEYKHKAEIEVKQKEQECQQEYLEDLKRLNVDVNEYSLELNKLNNKTDFLYKMIN
jgi:DNA anti-recombination protein RmuC